MVDETREYRLDPAGFAAHRRRMITRIAFMILLVAGVFVFFVTSGTNSAPLIRYLPPMALLFCAFGYRLFRGVRRSGKSWNSFRVWFDAAGSIHRKLEGTPDLKLDPGEITRIDETPGEGILIRTKDNARSIFVSANLINYDEFLSRAQRLAPIQSQKKLRPAHLWYPLIVIVTTVLIGAAMTVEDNRIGLPACALTIGVMWYCMVAVERSKILDAAVKTRMKIGYLVIFSLALNAGFRIVHLMH